MITIAYTAWLFAGITCLGIGPATALARVLRLPAQLWLPLALLVACVASYCVWLVYVVHPGAGRVVSVIWLVASFAVFAWMTIWGNKAAALRAVLMRRDAWLPGALMLALTLTYLCVLSSRAGTPNHRFTWGLPPDNDIPRLVAARMELPPAARPRGFLVSTWLVSDRPPLQAGFVLAVKPFDYSRYPMLTYQIVGTICQMGWVLAAYALARTIGLSRRQTIYALVACAASGFFLLHSVYVWPKLLSAWLFLVAVALMFCLAEGKIGGYVGWGLVASAIALSALAHGGALFSLLAVPVLAERLRLWRALTVPALLAGGAIALALMGAWLGYQRFIDPPGNRLMKMHLAGVADIDDRGLVQAIVDEYGKVGAVQYLRGRLTNITTQIWVDERAPDETLSDWIRRQQYFHHAAALDFLLIGLLRLFRGSSADASERPATHLQSLALFALATVVVWVLLMFTPGSAVVHQGSFAATTLLFVCGAAGLSAFQRRLGVAVLAAHGAVFAWIWLLTRQVSMGVGTATWHPAYIVAAAIFGLAFAALLCLIPNDAPSILPACSSDVRKQRCDAPAGSDSPQP